MDNKRFIDYLFSICNTDKAKRAVLRRAGKEETFWEALDVIHHFVSPTSPLINAYIAVSYCVANCGRATDGTIPIGRALKMIEDHGSDKEMSPKIKRLLAVSDVDELIIVLKRLVPFCEKREIQISYESLVKDIQLFASDKNKQSVKLHWASSYLAKEEQNVSE